MGRSTSATATWRRAGWGAVGDFQARRDFGDLFDLHPANTFLIKASYWFNY